MPRSDGRKPLVGTEPTRMTAVSLRLDATTAEALAALCQRQGCSVSEAVRRAIRDQALGDRQLLQDILAEVSALRRASGSGAPAPPTPASAPVQAILAWSQQLDEEGLE